MENRYIRQTLLEEIGLEGQKKLNKARVCIVGCGGLGSIIAPYLAGAGVGNITLIDGDEVDVSNLHRQVFYKENEVGHSKAETIANHCRQLNPDITIHTFSENITKYNIKEFTSSCQLVIECTDEIYTKYLVNDFCFLNKIPLVYGAIYKFEGYLSLFENKDENGIHLRDIFPSPQSDLPTCSEVGVLGTTAGLIALLQANEAIKFITGIGDSLCGKLLSYSLLNNKQMTLKLRKSYKKDMHDLFNKSAYNTLPETSWESVKMNKSELICIMERDEEYNCELPHQLIPLSEWEAPYDFLDESKSYAIFCKSGRRSADLVRRLDGKFYLKSISGGIQSL